MNRANQKMLRDLFLKDHQQTHPSIPDHCRPMPKFSDNSANALTKSIIAFLNYSGHQAERISNTGVFVNNERIVDDVVGRRKIGSSYYRRGAGTNGTADISAIVITDNLNTLSVKIEVKFGKDRQSEAQKIYQKRVEAVGGIYYIAKDFDSFYEFISDLIKNK